MDIFEIPLMISVVGLFKTEYSLFKNMNHMVGGWNKHFPLWQSRYFKTIIIPLSEEE